MVRRRVARTRLEGSRRRGVRDVRSVDGGMGRGVVVVVVGVVEEEEEDRREKRAARWSARREGVCDFRCERCVASEAAWVGRLACRDCWEGTAMAEGVWVNL